jgi:hypothetical protein
VCVSLVFSGRGFSLSSLPPNHTHPYFVAPLLLFVGLHLTRAWHGRGPESGPGSRAAEGARKKEGPIHPGGQSTAPAGNIARIPEIEIIPKRTKGGRRSPSSCFTKPPTPKICRFPPSPDLPSPF